MTPIRGRQKTREGVLKMFSKGKYIGEKYSFVREESDIGHGVNGAVYYIKVFEPGRKQITCPVVARFFEYDDKDKCDNNLKRL